jgi:DNA repair photolyase
LNAELKRTLEPRAPSPAARLRAVRALRAAGIPVGVLIAPIIPAVNDAELESIVEACAQAGARTCGYVVLRLPREVKDLFREWLDAHLPLRAAHVMSLINDMRGGKDNDARFGTRMKGEGPIAELIRTRFHAACRRYGLARAREVALSTDRFRVPPERDTATHSLVSRQFCVPGSTKLARNGSGASSSRRDLPRAARCT